MTHDYANAAYTLDYVLTKDTFTGVSYGVSFVSIMKK